MKHIYLIGILLLSGIIVWSVKFHGNYQTPKPDKALSKTPQQPNIPSNKAKVESPISLDPIWERSLFASYRGDIENSKTNSKNQRDSKINVIELIGVCKFGSFAGATILDKTPIRSAVGKSHQKPGAVFYHIGEVLKSGYVLKSVTRNTATLSRGISELVLELDFGNPASINRNNQEVNVQSKVIENESKRLSSKKITVDKKVIDLSKIKKISPLIEQKPVKNSRKKISDKIAKKKRQIKKRIQKNNL